MSRRYSDATPPADANTTLLLAPSLHPADGSFCVDLLAGRRPAHAVSVTLTDTPAQRLAVWERHTDYTPDSVVIVRASDESTNAPALPAWVDTVDTPMNLTRLGIAITEALEAGPPGRTAMCFRSLTVLLQYVDRDAVCRFLDALVPRIEAMDVRAHFHADPAALEGTTVDALAGRLDTVVDTREQTPEA